MVTKFLSIDQEKQDRILNSAIKEFALKGYEKASTNEIVKEAGISKGLLFHYFKNKKGLYLFLYDQMYQVIVEELFEKIDWDDKDILSRCKRMATLKFDVFLKYPQLFEFLKSAYFEESNEVRVEIGEKTKELMAMSSQKLFAEIDYSKFKDGIDVEKALSVIIWTLEGFSNQHQEKVKILSFEELQQNEMMTELDGYVEFLRKSFYK